MILIYLLLVPLYVHTCSINATDGTFEIPVTCTSSALEVYGPVTHIEAFSLQRHTGHIYHIELKQCEMKVIPWQSMVSYPKSIDITTCPLACDCRNDYLWGQSKQVFINGAKKPCVFNCTTDGYLKVNSLKVQQIEGVEQLRLEVDIHAPVDEKLIKPKRQYFNFGTERHPFTEEITAKKMVLVMNDTSHNHYHLVHFYCWHCLDYHEGKYELPSNNTNPPLVMTIIPVVYKDRKHLKSDDYQMDINGQDLVNVTLTVSDGKENETRLLPTIHGKVNFFQSMIVKGEHTGIISPFHRSFLIFLDSCIPSQPDCRHISGNFSFTVCKQLLDSTESLLEEVQDDICVTKYQSINEMKEKNLPNPSSKSPMPRKSGLILVVICIFVFLPLCFICILKRKTILIALRDKLLIWRKRGWHTQSRSSRRTSRTTEETMLRLEERESLSSSDYSGTIIPCIKGGSIQIHEKIGKGAFGEVYCGSWENTGERSVAVKTIAQADEEIEKEAQVLSRLDHPNIVRLHGMTRDGDRLLLVFEMMNMGDLRSYLKQRAPQASNYSQFPPALVIDELKWIIREIIKGVRYLGAQQIVHRDLAARNCLVNGMSDLRCCSVSQRPPITVKISDFGMSRRLTYQSDYYRMQNHSLLPVRWLPPEAINQHKFSHASDIWALGVTMWEVFSYGEVPFDTLSNHEVVSYAMAGMRPPRPKHCPQEVYEVMEKCWAVEPEDRISSEDILLHPAIQQAINTGI